LHERGVGSNKDALRRSWPTPALHWWVVDMADELLRAELQRAIWEHLLGTEGAAPQVEIREWSRVDELSFPSQESSYRGELFLSLPRLRDDANRNDLHEAAERLRRGFEFGVVDTRIKNVAVEELPPGHIQRRAGQARDPRALVT
jgi:hypothetical protein